MLTVNHFPAINCEHDAAKSKDVPIPFFVQIPILNFKIVLIPILADNDT